MWQAHSFHPSFDHCPMVIDESIHHVHGVDRHRLLGLTITSMLISMIIDHYCGLGKKSHSIVSAGPITSNLISLISYYHTAESHHLNILIKMSSQENNCRLPTIEINIVCTFTGDVLTSPIRMIYFYFQTTIIKVCPLPTTGLNIPN